MPLRSVSRGVYTHAHSSSHNDYDRRQGLTSEYAVGKGLNQADACAMGQRQTVTSLGFGKRAEVPVAVVPTGTRRVTAHVGPGL
jgi:hypothetical protein